MYSNGSSHTDRETAVQQRRALRAVHDTGLPIERDKEKCMPKCACASPLDLAHSLRKKRQSSALIICAALVFYTVRLFLFSHGRRSQIVGECKT